MNMAALISLEDYLRTSYPDGDREYVDGVVMERNLGTFQHARWWTRMVVYLSNKYSAIWSVVEDGLLHTVNPDIALPLGEIL